MARPFKDAEDRKDADLRIPVTAAQKALIVKAAKAAGIDMAAWARPVLEGAARALLTSPAGPKRPKKKRRTGDSNPSGA